MPTVRVPLGARAYTIEIERGVLACAGRRIANLVTPSGAVVLTHPALRGPYAEVVAGGLRDAGVATSVVVVPAGERHKTLRTVGRLYDALLAARLDRQGLVVTVGGGVIGDVGGYVAATYLRGIAFVQAPTSLLAQVDAAIGGKTGVDLPRGKNLVGAIHQPRAVFIDPDSLRSLPRRHLRSGLAEIVKHGIILDSALFDALARDPAGALSVESAVLFDAIVRSAEMKAGVVAEDETEQGRRAILNFGHTVGHAIEVLTGYRRYLHGEAVAIGMVAAAAIGEELGVTPSVVRDRAASVLAALGLPVEFPGDLPIGDLMDALTRDKKAVRRQHRFVLAERIGAVRIVDDVPSGAIVGALRRLGGSE